MLCIFILIRNEKILQHRTSQVFKKHFEKTCFVPCNGTPSSLKAAAYVDCKAASSTGFCTRARECVLMISSLYLVSPLTDLSGLGGWKSTPILCSLKSPILAPLRLVIRHGGGEGVFQFSLCCSDDCIRQHL